MAIPIFRGLRVFALESRSADETLVASLQADRQVVIGNSTIIGP